MSPHQGSNQLATPKKNVKSYNNTNNSYIYWLQIIYKSLRASKTYLEETKRRKSLCSALPEEKLMSI